MAANITVRINQIQKPSSPGTYTDTMGFLIFGTRTEATSHEIPRISTPSTVFTTPGTIFFLYIYYPPYHDREENRRLQIRRSDDLPKRP